MFPLLQVYRVTDLTHPRERYQGCEEKKGKHSVRFVWLLLLAPFPTPARPLLVHQGGIIPSSRELSSLSLLQVDAQVTFANRLAASSPSHPLVPLILEALPGLQDETLPHWVDHFH